MVESRVRNTIGLSGVMICCISGETSCSFSESSWSLCFPIDYVAHYSELSYTSLLESSMISTHILHCLLRAVVNFG